MLLEANITIQRPIAEVFKIATCRDRCVVWQSTLLSSTQTQKTPEVVGTIFEQETSLFGGKSYKNRSLVTVNDAPRRFAFEELEGPFGYKAEFQFEPTAGDGTKFSVRVEGNAPSGMLKLVPIAIIKAVAERRIETDLNTLKVLMENGIDPLSQLQTNAK